MITTKVSEIQKTEQASEQTPGPAELTKIAEVYQEMSEMGSCGIYNISFSPDSTKIILSISSGGSLIALYSTIDFRLLMIAPLDTNIKKIDWSPDSSKFIFSEGDNLKIFDATTGRVLTQIQPSTRQGSTCIMNRNGSNDQIFTWMGDSHRIIRKIDNAVQILDASTGSVLNETPIDDVRLGSIRQEDRYACGFSLEWSPNGEQLLTIGQYQISDKTGKTVVKYFPMRLWDTANMNLIKEVRLSFQAYANVKWSPDGKSIIVNAYGGLSQVFNANTLEPLKNLDNPPTGTLPYSFLWSPDSRWSAFYDEDVVVLYDTKTGEWKNGALNQPSRLGKFIAWMPDSRQLLFLSSSSLIPSYSLFDLETGQSTSILDKFINK